MAASIVVWLELSIVVPTGKKAQETKMKVLPQQVVAYHPQDGFLALYLASGLMFLVAMTVEQYEAAINSYYKQVAVEMNRMQQNQALKQSIKIVK